MLKNNSAVTQEITNRLIRAVLAIAGAITRLVK